MSSQMSSNFLIEVQLYHSEGIGIMYIIMYLILNI